MAVDYELRDGIDWDIVREGRRELSHKRDIADASRYTPDELAEIVKASRVESFEPVFSADTLRPLATKIWGGTHLIANFLSNRHHSHSRTA